MKLENGWKLIDDKAKDGKYYEVWPCDHYRVPDIFIVCWTIEYGWSTREGWYIPGIGVYPIEPTHYREIRDAPHIPLLKRD
jgi:hypothetical protein